MANEAGSWIPTTRAQAHQRKESSHELGHLHQEHADSGRDAGPASSRQGSARERAGWMRGGVRWSARFIATAGSRTGITHVEHRSSLRFRWTNENRSSDKSTTESCASPNLAVKFWPPWSEFRFSNRRLPYTGMLSCRTTFISIAIWPPGSKSLLRFSVGQFAVSRTTRPSFASFWPSTARPSSLHPPPMPCNNPGHALRRE